MPTYPPATPEDYRRLSELMEAFDNARTELAREVMRLYPKSHKSKAALMKAQDLAGVIKSGLEGSARSHLGSRAPAISLFYGPPEQRQRARDEIASGDRLIITAASEVIPHPAQEPLPPGAFWAD